MARDRRGLTWEGTVREGWVDLKFKMRAFYMALALYLDIDGDGSPLPTDPEWIYLRQHKVNPPVNPFIIGAITPGERQLIPTRNFKIGSGDLTRIVWLTTVEELEAQAR